MFPQYMGQEPLKVKGYCVYESKKSQKLQFMRLCRKDYGYTLDLKKPTI